VQSSLQLLVWWELVQVLALVLCQFQQQRVAHSAQGERWARQPD
jgi:hypothetical protein